MDITTATQKDFSELMAKAVRLGAIDETGGNKPKTANELLIALGVSGFRNGHATALRQAYSAGRFHVSSMGA